jgi:hypothetical protein
MTIDYPAETGAYKKKEEFVPTETTVLDNGDFYIADGYGAQYIMQYDAKGKLKNFFGGRGDGNEHLDNAHGITIDTRESPATLLITDRTRNCFKRFFNGWEIARGNFTARRLRVPPGYSWRSLVCCCASIT